MRSFGAPGDTGNLNLLIWRNLTAHPLRSVLTALAVALGVAMTVAADVVSASILNALADSEDALTFLVGLLDQLDRMLILIGVMVTAAAGFLVFNAFAMAVTQRRQQIGALRSLGMTRRQVMQLVLVEALITGGAGALLGLVAGPLLGRGTIAMIKAMLGEGLFVFSENSVSLPNLALATVLGLGVTLLSVLIPARRATCISPLVALREEMSATVEAKHASPLLWLGLAAVVLLFIYLALAPPGEWIQPPWDIRLTVLFVGLWLGGLALVLPALIGDLGQWLRRPLMRLWGATGRLTADNVRRGRGRVTLTVLTLAVALTTIVSMTGFISFMFNELMRPRMEGVTQLGAWIVTQFEYEAGMVGYAGQDSLALSPEAVVAVREAVQDRAVTLGWYFAVVPELSFFGSSYFSFVVDPRGIQRGGDQFFTFTQGSWETALPIMESGCGVLIAPSVAAKNGVSLGEHITVTSADGPVECTVAGIGSPYVGASIVGLAAGDAFGVVEGVSQPLVLLVWPQPGVDRDAFRVDLMSLTDHQPGLYLSEIKAITDLQVKVLDKLPSMFNALLLLAIVAAALGVVNTTVMSVAERRRELGLLRAVGVTRRQVSRVVTGEAALMGLVGGGLGLVGGVGVTVILAVVYGGNAWGYPDLDLWPAAGRSIQPALLNGLVGLAAAPFICAGAAWLPARSILRGSAVETLLPSFRSVRLRRGKEG
jgi:putative ABC transport system permease protein